MPPSHDPSGASAASTLIALAAAAAGVLGVGAMWTVMNVQVGGANGWGALVAAADAALLLRLAGMPAGRGRAAIGVGTVVATTALVAFLTAATRMGLAMGLQPLESAGRMGPGLAWTLAESSASHLDILVVLVSLPIAWWICR